MSEAPKTRLDSWKAIADYLKVDEVTAIRWEKLWHLPVHRMPGGRRRPVFAYKEEIDAWMVNGGEEGIRNSELGISRQPSAFSPEGDGDGRGESVKGAEEAVTNASAAALPAEDVDLAGAAKNNLPKDAARDELSPWMTALIPKGRRRFFLHLAIAGFVLTVLAVAYILARPPALPRVLGFTQLTNDGLSKGGGMVSDGAYIYFSELTPSGWVISKISTAGGDPLPISAEFQVPAIQALNRNRGELLITDPASVEVRPNLWALPITGGLRRRVGTIQTHDAAWTPEGDAIIYSEGKDLLRCSLDGSGSQKFASLSGLPSHLRWSPDGKSIRLTLDFLERRESEIWEMKSDGSEARPLFPKLSGFVLPNDGDWTLDGRYFVFRTRRSPTSEMWAMQDGGVLWRTSTVPRQLTTMPLSFGGAMPGNDDRKLFVMGLDIQHRLFQWEESSGRFLPYLAHFAGDEVDYSRDGKWLAYIDGSGKALWKRHADGSQPAQLTFSFQVAELPRWSPDGKWIAFMGLKTPTEIWRVYVIPAEGGDPHEVLPSSNPQGAPTWSPHGRRLAFGELPPTGDTSSWRPVIHIVDLAANRETTLPGSEGLWTARWSPDGSHIAAMTTDSKTIKLYDLRSGQWQDVAAAARVSDMNWSRDSGVLYFEDVLPPSGPAIYRLTLRDRRVEKVAGLLGNADIQSSWLGFAPDGSILVSGPVGSSEIYSMEVEWP